MVALAWDGAGREVADAVREAEAARVAERIWDRDASIWSSDPAVQRTIGNRLGWLDAPAWASERRSELDAFAAEAKEFRRFVLLGMGGSSLAPEVLSRTFGRDVLTVVDSTDPTEILAAEGRIDDRTMFFVASKSGETIETRSHAAYFLDRTGDPSRFVAITDPGSPLENLARERGFRRVFLNPPDIGGRYSALSFFGLVPAVAIGIDPAPLLKGALDEAEGARASRGGGALELGAGLGELARGGRDKVTFVAPGAEAFGAWAEQLIAESTGKDGKGLIPIDGEPLGTSEVYGDDRVFARLGSTPDAPAGHASATIGYERPEDLGRLFFAFEFATAVAGWRLGVNPFDEPNVSESKQNTARLIETYERDGALPAASPDAEERGVQLFGAGGASSVVGGLRSFFGGARPGDYAALLAFAPRNATTEDALRGIRLDVRDRLRIATTAGFGPRYLHSTGQLHKGGPATGLYLQITTEHPSDVPIPGAAYSFGVLQAAQAAGDFDSLARHGRRVLRVHLTEGVERGFPTLAGLLRYALAST